jgi:hypothetical protein
MRLLFKIFSAISFIVVAAYYLYFYVGPSVTFLNKSEYLITEVNVRLPENNLNFGSIEVNQKNSIHYSLPQPDGNYIYSFKLDRRIITGSCGNLTNYEFNKRFVITVNKNNMVACAQ